jgi:hypothetical protein
LVEVGSFTRYTIAPVGRFSASSEPPYSVVNTRSLDTVVAPSGRVGTLVSQSTLPVFTFSASISPPGAVPAAAVSPTLSCSS